MADLKISQLTALTGANVVATDVLPIVDVSETVTKKIAASELVTYVTSGLGTYTAFTPAIGGWTIGNGTIDAKYCRVNGFVHYFGSITAGSTTTFASELWYRLPINQDGGSGRPLGTCYTNDVSTGQAYAGVVRALGANEAYATVHTADMTYIRMRTLDPITPVTWTTGDIHYFNLYYKAV